MSVFSLFASSLIEKCAYVFPPTGFLKLIRSQVLKTLYSEESPFKNYSLVVCGHSLGAGCASILALMLRPAYPSLKCFAYEPPGCIFDDAMSKKVEDFIVSTVRNDDLVPRLSHHNFGKLCYLFCSDSSI